MYGLDISNACVGVYRPGIVTSHGIERAVEKCRDIDSILTVEVWVIAESYRIEREMLYRMEFREGGTGTHDGKTFVKFRRVLRNAGDGIVGHPDVDLAVPAPVLAPSQAEQEAVAGFIRLHPEYKQIQDRIQRGE